MPNCGILYDHPRHFIDTTGDGTIEPCDTSVRPQIVNYEEID